MSKENESIINIIISFYAETIVGLLIMAMVYNSVREKIISPFDERLPSQFIFLTCIVASTLTLAIIGNRLRDRRDALRSQESGESKPTRPLCEIKKSIINCHKALTQISYILWVQLVLLIVISLKIMTSSTYFDVFISYCSFYVFAILWSMYFIIHGGGKDVAYPFRKRFNRNQNSR